MHPAGHVGDIWCRMWRYLSWTPPPTDSKYLTMRWWPWWRHHLRVRQVPRAPFMAWLPEHCGVDRVSVLYASSDIMDARLPARRRRGALAPTDAGAGAHYRRRGHVFHWWCHGQLVGVLLPRRRLVLGAVQKVAHRHARGGGSAASRCAPAGPSRTASTRRRAARGGPPSVGRMVSPRKISWRRGAWNRLFRLWRGAEQRSGEAVRRRRRLSFFLFLG